MLLRSASNHSENKRRSAHIYQIIYVTHMLQLVYVCAAGIYLLLLTQQMVPAGGGGGRSPMRNCHRINDVTEGARASAEIALFIIELSRKMTLADILVFAIFFFFCIHTNERI